MPETFTLNCNNQLIHFLAQTSQSYGIANEPEQDLNKNTKWLIYDHFKCIFYVIENIFLSLVTLF